MIIPNIWERKKMFQTTNHIPIGQISLRYEARCAAVAGDLDAFRAFSGHTHDRYEIK